MELVYLWIDNYKDIIINKEFNFSSEFDIEKKKVGKNITINISDKTYKFNLFEENDENPVKDIFGIIGENGVGKSSLISAILDHLFTGFSVYKLDKEEDGKKFLIIYSDDFILEETPLYNVEKYNYELTNNEQSEYLVEKENVIFTKIRDSYSHTVYYDNIFNPYNLYKNINISIHNQVEGKLDVNISTNYEFFKRNGGDPLKFASNEIKNTLHYIGSPSFDNDSIRKPKKIIIILKNFFKVNYPIFDYSKAEEILVNDIICIIINNFKDKKLNDKFFKLFIEEKIDEIYNLSKNEFKNSISKSKISNAISIIKAFKKVNFIEKSSIKTDEKNNKYFFEMNLDDENIRIISDFLMEIKKHSIKQHFLDYDYEIEYSSGERSLLTLFTRLYTKYDEIKNSNKNQVLLLLDEPDILYHPEWQRQFIHNLIRFLNKVYINKKIKIILTSHSPFIASDLPKENIIMLKKDENGKCVVVENAKNTFGANIFDLYSEAFFVKSSFGEFAKDKIKEVVNLFETSLNEEKEVYYLFEKEIEERKEEIKYIINSIGEPIIRKKLENMLEEYEQSPNNVNEERKLLEEFKKLTTQQKKELLEKNNGDTDVNN